MKILILNTCGATVTVAFAETTPQPAVIAAASLPGRAASERLVATIRELAATVEDGLHSLEAIAVVSGPGSFTGLRVGLSAAKGLCEALGLPLIAISRLAVLAHLAAKTSDARTVFALFDAGRGEAYLGIYTTGVRIREALVTHAQLLAAIAETTTAQPESATDSIQIVTCEPTIAQAFAELNPQLIAEPTAADALALALLRIKAKDYEDPATIDANYLRRTDAEIFAKPSSACDQQRCRTGRHATASGYDSMTALPVRVRPARREDIEPIVSLDRATELAPHWPVAVYAAILDATSADPELPPQRCLIVAERIPAQGATQHTPLAGFAVALVHPVSSSNEAGVRIAELEDVVVAAHCRRAGIARALCAAVLDWCRLQGATEAVLEVRAANAGAIALYTQLGFRQIGRRPGYYRDPEEDAIAMRCDTADSYMV